MTHQPNYVILPNSYNLISVCIRDNQHVFTVKNYEPDLSLISFFIFLTFTSSRIALKTTMIKMKVIKKNVFKGQCSVSSETLVRPGMNIQWIVWNSVHGWFGGLVACKHCQGNRCLIYALLSKYIFYLTLTW